MSVDLMAAILAGDLSRAAGSLDAGADPDFPLRLFWREALEMERQLGPDRLPLLLRVSERLPESPVLWTWTPLLLATACGNWDAAQILLERGANARVEDELGATPLLFAVRAGHAGLVHALLRQKGHAGADPDCPFADEGQTPLMLAAGLGDGSGLAELHHDFAPRWPEEEGAPSPARLAAYGDILSALLAAGADPNAALADGTTPLIFAASRGWTEGVRRLIEAGARLDAEAEFVGTPLMAALPDHLDTAALLIERGADVNARDRSGMSVLSRSLGPRLPSLKDIVRPVSRSGGRGLDSLLNAGQASIPPAKPDLVERGEDVTALRFLLDHGADPELRFGEGGRTMLFTAAAFDSEPAIRLLIERGADVNARDEGGRTALHLAAYEGRPRAAAALLAAGAEVNARSRNGHTPLGAAALMGVPENMVRKIESMPRLPPDPKIERSLEQLRQIRADLGDRAADLPDPESIAALPAHFWEMMHANFSEWMLAQRSGRAKVVEILKNAGATE
jgi:ankyrin repeat protein